jgi:hypothetical protein
MASFAILAKFESVVDPDPHHLGNLDLDPHQGDLPYSYPHPDPYQI